MDKAPIKVGILGFGPLGENLAKHISKDDRFQLLTIIDKDPKKIGTKFEEITILENLDEVLKEKSLDLCFITTSSLLERIKEDIVLLSNNGVSAISSCEELIFPWKSHGELASELNKLAQKNETRILGTGINPGFLMDYLPITLSKPFLDLKEITYTRKIDTKFRRTSFVEKVGVGLSIEEFKTKEKQGRIGHVGFKQSVDMLTKHFNWELQSYDENIEAVIEDQIVQGIKQTALCSYKKDRKISLLFLATKNETDQDLISLKLDSGKTVDIEIKQGINGESGTVAMLMNSAEKLLNSPPGLRTMLDL